MGCFFIWEIITGGRKTSKVENNITLHAKSCNFKQTQKIFNYKMRAVLIATLQTMLILP